MRKVFSRWSSLVAVLGFLAFCPVSFSLADNIDLDLGGNASSPGTHAASVVRKVQVTGSRTSGGWGYAALRGLTFE